MMASLIHLTTADVASAADAEEHPLYTRIAHVTIEPDALFGGVMQ